MAYGKRTSRTRRSSSRSSYTTRRPVARSRTRVRGVRRASGGARRGSQTVKIVVEHRAPVEAQRPAFLDTAIQASTEPKRKVF